MVSACSVGNSIASLGVNQSQSCGRFILALSIANRAMSLVKSSMATFPHEQMRCLEDFLSSLRLFFWAKEMLEIPWRRAQFCEVAAGGEHMELLQWGFPAPGARRLYWQLRGEGICRWSGCARKSLPAPGSRSRARPRRVGGSWTCCGGCGDRRRPARGTAKGGYIELLQWLQDQTPAYVLDEGTLVAAAEAGQLETVQWLRAQ